MYGIAKGWGREIRLHRLAVDRYPTSRERPSWGMGKEVKFGVEPSRVVGGLQTDGPVTLGQASLDQTDQSGQDGTVQDPECVSSTGRCCVALRYNTRIFSRDIRSRDFDRLSTWLLATQLNLCIFHNRGVDTIKVNT